MFTQNYLQAHEKMSFSINKIPFIFYVFGFSIIGNSIYFNQITHPDLNQVTIIKSSTDKTFLFPDSSSFTQVSNNSIKLNKLGNGMTELTNLDYQPQSYRVTVLRLSKVNGQDIYQPSDDLLVRIEQKIQLKTESSNQSLWLVAAAVLLFLSLNIVLLQISTSSEKSVSSFALELNKSNQFYK